MPVVGVMERQGRVRAVAVPNVQPKTILPIVAETVEKGATVHTDEFATYDELESMGYAHKRIVHAEKTYVTGDIHTQTIDGFWGNVKNGIRGVYHYVSSKYLQHYLNEYSFRYNHRNDEKPMFKSFPHRI